MVDDNYNDVEPGQEGEMLVRSPLVTQGYFNNPQATKDAFHGEWFCTGDIAVLRNGKFYIVDRKKVWGRGQFDVQNLTNSAGTPQVQGSSSRPCGD